MINSVGHGAVVYRFFFCGPISLSLPETDVGGDTALSADAEAGRNHAARSGEGH